MVLNCLQQNCFNEFLSPTENPPEPSLQLNRVDIPVVTECTFLGVIFDSKLSFILLIKYLKSKCLKSLNLLKVVSRFDFRVLNAFYCVCTDL